MIFSAPELAGLNSISGGGDLPGIQLKVPSFGTHDDLWASVNESLKEKGIVGTDGHLTAIGMVPVKVVEMYRTAGRYVFLGTTKVSLDADGSLTMIGPVGDDWQVIRTAKEALMIGLLKKFPFMCGKSSPGEHPGGWEPLPYEKWLDAMAESELANLLVANSYQKGQPPTDLMAYGLSRGKGFEYNLSYARGRRISVRDIRVTVAGMIGLEEGGSHA